MIAANYRMGASVRVLVGIIFLCFAICQTSANSELDALTMMFQNGFSSVSGNFGGPNVAAGPADAPDVDNKMRELYMTIEKGLLEARQAAAISRSSMTTFVLEKMNLV